MAKKKKQKKKLTPAQKRAKKEHKKNYTTVFMNGKQVRVKKPPMIDGMDADEFIRRNADPICLHQNEMWEYMDEGDHEEGPYEEGDHEESPYEEGDHEEGPYEDEDIPF